MLICKATQAVRLIEHIEADTCVLHWQLKAHLGHVHRADLTLLELYLLLQEVREHLLLLLLLLKLLAWYCSREIHGSLLGLLLR